VVASTNPTCAENLTVGATCAAGPVTLAYYNNYGAPLNAIAAPGGSYPVGGDTAVSGWVRGACSNGIANTADGLPVDSAHSYGCFNLGHTPYVQAMGTSASAPLAAGAAALLFSANPGWTPDQVVAAMRANPAFALPAGQ
jgi:subtilisin family serine protease